MNVCKANDLKQEISGRDWKDSSVVQGHERVHLERKGRRTSISAPLNEITRQISTPVALLAYILQSIR